MTLAIAIASLGRRSDIARALGVSRQAVTDWCRRGRITPRRAQQLIDLAGRLGADLDEVAIWAAAGIQRRVAATYSNQEDR